MYLYLYDFKVKVVKERINQLKILILCTGNSCRSQMAEGFLQSFDPNLVVKSAGTFPAAKVSSMAIRVMAEAGIDISKNSPKSVDEFLNDQWDYVITVCDDPSHVTGSEDFILSEFRRIRDLIRKEFWDFYIKNLKH
jgi:arsenate reductase